MSSQGTRHIKTTLGANIKASRESQDITQRELAQTMNVDPQYVSRWERGVVMPSAVNVQALSDALGVGVGWLYTDHSTAAA